MANNYPKENQQGFQRTPPVVPVPPVVTDNVELARALSDSQTRQFLRDSEYGSGREAEYEIAKYAAIRDLMYQQAQEREGMSASREELRLPDSFKRTNYSGYYLADRDEVLALLDSEGVFPLYERVVFEHITLQYPDKETAPSVELVEIVGHASSDGVQAVLVEVDGVSERPDGKLYHITLSLAEGHKPAESNAMLASTPVEPLSSPISIRTIRF